MLVYLFGYFSNSLLTRAPKIGFAFLGWATILIGRDHSNSGIFAGFRDRRAGRRRARLLLYSVPLAIRDCSFSSSGSPLGIIFVGPLFALTLKAYSDRLLGKPAQTRWNTRALYMLIALDQVQIGISALRLGIFERPSGLLSYSLWRLVRFLCVSLSRTAITNDPIADQCNSIASANFTVFLSLSLSRKIRISIA